MEQRFHVKQLEPSFGGAEAPEWELERWRAVCTVRRGRGRGRGVCLSRASDEQVLYTLWMHASYVSLGLAVQRLEPGFDPRSNRSFLFVNASMLLPRDRRGSTGGATAYPGRSRGPRRGPRWWRDTAESRLHRPAGHKTRARCRPLLTDFYAFFLRPLSSFYNSISPATWTCLHVLP